jgi:hypothetical protein
MVGKWRVLDGKVESVLMSDSELLGGCWRENEVTHDNDNSWVITVKLRFHPECRGVILTSEKLSKM